MRDSTRDPGEERLNLELLAQCAYRRPVTRQQIDELVKIRGDVIRTRESFDEATGMGRAWGSCRPSSCSTSSATDGDGKVFEITVPARQPALLTMGDDLAGALVGRRLVGGPARYGTLNSPSAGGVTRCSLGFISCGIHAYGTR